MMTTPLDVPALRTHFPALDRTVNGQPVAYFDGPAGSQVPREVADAVADYLIHTNANHGGPFATSIESDRRLDAAHEALADFVGTSDADTIAFGGNTTTLTFALSRAIGRTWTAGDEILVSRLDHDANVSPWILAAQDAGVAIRHIEINPDDATLDLQSFHDQLSPKTKLVAVGLASNATGSVNPIREMADAAHAVGALISVDAVHYAPHRLIDVVELDCDFLLCSAYKFFGPHVGVQWGRRELLEELVPYKLRPAPDELPGRWMTGTQNHEGIHGSAAAVNYLAGLIDDDPKRSRRERLKLSFQAIRTWEETLLDRLLDGLAEMPAFRIWGINDRADYDRRVPTVSITHSTASPQEIAAAFGKQGLFCWCGNHYAYPFTESVGLEPDGTLRIGLLHYNTLDEVERLLDALRAWM